MKLYFPTTTMNLSEILSTESISPIAYYKARHFGSPRFRETNVSGNHHGIQMFLKKPLVNLSKSKYQEYPLYIEIDFDSSEIKDSKVEHNMYYIRRSVYLNRNSVKFIFQSEDHMNFAIKSLKLSPTCKMYDKYQDSFHYENDKNLIHFTKRYNLDDTTQSVFESDLRIDERMNKLKGFLYGVLFCKVLRKHEIKSASKINNEIVGKSITDLYNSMLIYQDSELEGNDKVLYNLALTLSEFYSVNFKKSKNHLTNEITELLNSIDYRYGKVSLSPNELFENLNEYELSFVETYINNYLNEESIRGEMTSDILSKLASDFFEHDTDILDNDELDKLKEKILMNSIDVKFSDFESYIGKQLYLFFLKGYSAEDIISLASKNGEKDVLLALLLHYSMIGFAAMSNNGYSFLFKMLNNVSVMAIDDKVKAIYNLLKIEVKRDKLLSQAARVKKDSNEFNIELMNSSSIKRLYSLRNQEKIRKIQKLDGTLVNEKIIQVARSSDRVLVHFGEQLIFTMKHRKICSEVEISKYKSSFKNMNLDIKFSKNINYPIIELKRDATEFLNGISSIVD